MEPLDLRAFRELNGLAGQNAWIDAAIVFCATYLIFVLVALAIGYAAVAWKTADFKKRIEHVLHALLTVGLAFGLERLIGFLWFRPRPFAVLEGVVKLVDRMPAEKSFPSGHATMAFAIAFGILIHDRRWGKPLLFLAAVVAAGRIAAGVHYPSDALGGIVVAFAAAVLTAPIKKALDPVFDWFMVPGKNGS